MATKGTRTFGGKRYTIADVRSTKADATVVAARFRRGGYKTRIVPHKEGYFLYTRKARYK